MNGRNLWLGFAVVGGLAWAVAGVVAEEETEYGRRRPPEVVPKVTPITSDDATDWVDPPRPKSFSQVFAGPARLPWWVFDRVGNPVEDDALVIYEGMEVTVNRKGEYDLRFRVEAPVAEITLRLQFAITSQDERTLAKVHHGTITIPPIRISPETQEDLDSTSQSFIVTYSGKSETLKQLLIPVCQKCNSDQPSRLSDHGIQLTRAGTARFGGPPRN